MKPALTVVGAVLVALFIQKSDGNTAVQTLLALLMATVGCLLVWASVIGLTTRHRKHEHRLRIVFSNTTVVCLGGLAGGLLLWTSFSIIDRSPEGYVTAPGGDDEIVIFSDASGIALRNPQLALGTTTIRLLVTVVNIRNLPVVADQAEFTMWW